MARVAEIEEFRDLVLRGPVDRLPLLRKTLIDKASSPWRYAVDREAVIARYMTHDADVLAFEREDGEGVDAVGLVLWSRADGFEVVNIVPRKVKELSAHRYNNALEDFISRVARPAADVAGYDIETTSAQQGLDDWVDDHVAEALRQFSGCANKATGSSHPADRNRWFAFLLAAHHNRGSLDADRLKRWLVEGEGWSERRAEDLVMEYEFGLALLRKHDHNRA